MVTIIDADGNLLGRLASNVAKRSLQGEEFVIVNAEKAIVSGKRAMVLANYEQKHKRGSVEGGPFFPRRPDLIMKRTIRGMLPYKRQRGAEALKKVMVYTGVPAQFQGKEFETIETAGIERLNNPKYITLGEISRILGSKF
ncbi:50S ribosomal protein L13 [Methanofollis aquaemaris]|uniref:Large ribosomal subunit protein uL13 n=1 Tax=Methanofollis aquaemaris TaxID=126734 RepID=A0A8A3S7A3_9EURY|nr:50S ribosomal protein L13 [Methanofollis aquaemaris]QSZ67739.1 50S ribosomal protein L13 [Methanofollis aquaemaris]